MKPLLTLNELVVDYWPKLLPGVQECLKYSTGNEDISSILRDILNEDLLVWVWESPGGMVDGFVMTKVLNVPTSPPQKHLFIDSAWCAPWVQPLRLTKRTHQHIEKFAKACECSKIRTCTQKDMARWMAEFGFKPGLKEFEKEVL